MVYNARWLQRVVGRSETSAADLQIANRRIAATKIFETWKGAKNDSRTSYSVACHNHAAWLQFACMRLY